MHILESVEECMENVAAQLKHHDEYNLRDVRGTPSAGRARRSVVSLFFLARRRAILRLTSACTGVPSPSRGHYKPA